MLIRDWIETSQLESIDEATNPFTNNSFKIDVLDANKFIKANNCPEVTNAVMFQNGTEPHPEGLLSYELFGITFEERSNIFGYIDLGEPFIQPAYYKVWLKLDKNLRGCIYETGNYRLDDNGYLVIDDNGEHGLPFLYKNQNKLGFKDTKKDIMLKFLLDGQAKKQLFTDKLIVIPPYYRDVDTKSGGRLGVGQINQLYALVINTVRALKETSIFGLDISGATRGKIQDALMHIYNWFTVGETEVGQEHTGSGMFKKFGIMRRSVLSKTTDNSARLVLSAPNLNVNKKEDLMVDVDHCRAPLSAVLVTAYPFVIYHLSRWFDNEFGGKITYNAYDNKGSMRTVELDNPSINFSPDRFDAEMNEYIHGYSNRFKPIKVPTKDGRDITLRFKGYSISEEEYIRGKREDTTKLIERDLTWLDLFYICAVESSYDKMAIITRYPIDYQWHSIADIE